MTASPDSASDTGLYVGVPLDAMVYYKNKAMDLHNEEEDFQFVALEEQQIPSTDADSRSQDTSISPERSTWEGVRDSVLGLLMSSVVAGAATGGYYATVHFSANLGDGYPAAPMLLAYEIILTLLYLGVYAASWSLLERLYQTFTSPRDTKKEDEETRRQFVDTVMWHSTSWNYVGLVLTGVAACCDVALRGTRRYATNEDWKILLLWAFVNSTVMLYSLWRPLSAYP